MSSAQDHDLGFDHYENDAPAEASSSRTSEQYEREQLLMEGLADGTLILSNVQHRMLEQVNLYGRKLFHKWGGTLTPVECREAAWDAIVASKWLREATRQNSAVIGHFVKTDLHYAACKKQIQIEGTVRKDGTRRGRAGSLDAAVAEDGSSRLELLQGSEDLDPAARIEMEADRPHYGPQAVGVLHETLPRMKANHREILELELAATPESTQAARAAQLGINVKTYGDRLRQARLSMARSLAARMGGEDCKPVRLLLKRPLVREEIAQVEIHLADCPMCKAWKMCYQPAASAILPFPLLTRWDAITLRVQGWFGRLLPGGEVAAAHGDTVATGAGLGGTATGGVLLAGGGTKVAATVCVSLVSCGLALGTEQIVSPSKGEKRSRPITTSVQKRAAGNLRPAPVGPPLVQPSALALPAPDRAPAPAQATRSTGKPASSQKPRAAKPSRGPVAPAAASPASGGPAPVAPTPAATPTPTPAAAVAPSAAAAPAPAPAPVAPERAGGSSSGPVAPTAAGTP